MGRELNPLLTDLDRLLAPVSAEQPAGIWLCYEGTYDQIREARREDDAGLPQGVWQTELKRADWMAVEALCAESLAQKSKDLQLAAWLLEAWIQLDGFVGAARGLKLIERLCCEYWEIMYPALDKDMTARLAPLQWINDKLSRRLRLLRVTQPSLEGSPAYSLADWDAAVRNTKDGAADAKATTVAKFQQSASLTPQDWLVETRRHVEETLMWVQTLDASIDERIGSLAPGLIRFRTETANIAHLLDTLIPPASNPPSEAPENGLENPLSDDSPVLPTVGHVSISPLTIHTREEAYKLLEEIAGFLYQVDPHSPTPYLIRRAVAWGSMHFDTLLPELVRDKGQLGEIARFLGLDQGS